MNEREMSPLPDVHTDVEFFKIPVGAEERVALFDNNTEPVYEYRYSNPESMVRTTWLMSPEIQHRTDESFDGAFQRKIVLDGGSLFELETGDGTIGLNRINGINTSLTIEQTAFDKSSEDYITCRAVYDDEGVHCAYEIIVDRQPYDAMADNEEIRHRLLNKPLSTLVEEYLEAEESRSMLEADSDLLAEHNKGELPPKRSTPIFGDISDGKIYDAMMRLALSPEEKENFITRIKTTIGRELFNVTDVPKAEIRKFMECYIPRLTWIAITQIVDTDFSYNPGSESQVAHILRQGLADELTYYQSLKRRPNPLTLSFEKADEDYYGNTYYECKRLKKDGKVGKELKDISVKDRLEEEGIVYKFDEDNNDPGKVVVSVRNLDKDSRAHVFTFPRGVNMDPFYSTIIEKNVEDWSRAGNDIEFSQS